MFDVYFPLSVRHTPRAKSTGVARLLQNVQPTISQKPKKDMKLGKKKKQHLFVKDRKA